MRAGQTSRHKATAVTYAEQRSTITGAMKKTATEGKTFHFFRQTFKEQAAMLGKEEGTRGTLIMECRKSPTTTAMTHFKHDGNLYRIECKSEDRARHTYNITATLVNE